MSGIYLVGVVQNIDSLWLRLIKNFILSKCLRNIILKFLRIFLILSVSKQLNIILNNISQRSSIRWYPLEDVEHTVSIGVCVSFWNKYTIQLILIDSIVAFLLLNSRTVCQIHWNTFNFIIYLISIKKLLSNYITNFLLCAPVVDAFYL
jgi:hypothetical protein